MKTLARLVDGYAVDVIVTPPSLEERFSPAWLAAHPFYDAPDDTRAGRPGTLNGGVVNWGTNPPAPPGPAQTPEILSASAFQGICEIGLGGNSVGATRFGGIIRAMSTTQDDLVFSTYQRFLKSTTFDFERSGALFARLISKGLMTAPERTAILAAWPMS